MTEREPPPASALVVRDASPVDATAVRELVTAAFRRSVEARLVERLRVRPDVFERVALDARDVVGHSLFAPVELVARPARPSRALALVLLSVRPERSSRGIGSRLVADGFAESRRRGARLVFVLGPGGYYRRFGFEPAAPRGVRCRWRVPDDSFRVVELEPGALAESAGSVLRFVREFDAV
jgi:putative acetyltransferase